ncbi:hypothetical protein JCM11491_007102 [Sporobolomyces phaffii]
MNAHHNKSSYRPPAPRHPQHFSSATLRLPLDRSHGSQQLWNAIERVPFGWQLDVVLPSASNDQVSNLIEQLKAEIDRTSRYQVVRGVNLASLLEPSFLTSFIRTGSLVAISLGGVRDEDVVAIDGRGRLVLSVCKDTYELLGLPGRASMHGSFRQRFIIEISLIDPAFRSGKPGFERVKRLLRDWPTETELFEQLQSDGGPRKGKTFDLVMSYVDATGHSQVIELPQTLESAAQSPSVSTRELGDVSIPVPAALPVAADREPGPQKRQRTSSGASRRTVRDDEVWWDAFREWRGLVALGAEDVLRWRTTEPDADEDADGDWGVPRDDSMPGFVTTLSVNGLLHPRSIAAVVENVLGSPSFRTVPFLSLILRPFPHAPISHTSAANPPVVGTGVRPNGKKRKRGRGRGEEEEADRERLEDVGGWEVVLRPSTTAESNVDWWLWEGQ